MRLMMRWCVAAALAWSCAACDSVGELERGSFSYSCTAVEDATCWDGNMGPRSIPVAFAVSAQFQMNVEGLAGGPLIVVPASSERGARTPDGDLQLNARGLQALLARDESSGFVKDFTYVRALRTRSLRVTAMREVGASPLETLTVSQGEPTTFYVRAQGDGGATLSGGITFTYLVEDETIVRVTPGATDSSEFEVAGVSEGATNVTISTGNHDSIFAIVVSAGGMP